MTMPARNAYCQNTIVIHWPLTPMLDPKIANPYFPPRMEPPIITNQTVLLVSGINYNSDLNTYLPIIHLSYCHSCRCSTPDFSTDLLFSPATHCLCFFPLSVILSIYSFIHTWRFKVCHYHLLMILSSSFMGFINPCFPLMETIIIMVVGLLLLIITCLFLPVSFLAHGKCFKALGGSLMFGFDCYFYPYANHSFLKTNLIRVLCNQELLIFFLT